MNILSVAYPLFPVRPDSGGGAEQVLASIDRGLINAGHTSIVIAAKGSQIAGELIEAAAIMGEITDEVRQLVQRTHLQCIEQALQEYPIDLVHFHGLDFYSYLPERSVPMLATLHLPVSFYPEWIFMDSHVQLNCVSHMQADSVPSGIRLPVVLNGIDICRFAKPARKKDFLLMLSRICPEKGIHIALEIAHRLDLPLVIAGPVHSFRDHQAYFSECVQPLLDRKRQYIGEVGPEAKAALFGEARCVMIPSRVAETSSLVAMEAISSGTPVIAFRSGALPEVIEDGETGFIVNSEDEMLEAVRRSANISRDTCRRIAQLRFDGCRMVNEYLRLYDSVIESACSRASGSV